MLDALLMALTALASPERLGYMALGVLIGYAIGVLPALGGLAGLSLVMPFIYGLDQVSALAMLVGLVAVAATADTFSSILMGIPGSSASQATILDGFPMARRGEAARALSASFLASMIGGLIGAVILTGAVLIARPLILALGTAELFMLALLGLSSAAAVAQAALPEREAHPGAFLAFEALTAALALRDLWPAVYVRFESGLLEELGFGLDLTSCAVTGTADDLAWVSPRTGRAVSTEAGAPYADRLLRLPPFLLGAQAGLGEGDVRDGLALTGHFLQRCVFNPLNRPLPEARDRMVERLKSAGLA